MENKRLVTKFFCFFIGIGIIMLYLTHWTVAEEIGILSLKKDYIGEYGKALKETGFSAQLFRKQKKSPGVPPTTETKAPPPEKKAEERTVVYRGYSKEFLQIKQLLSTGQADQVGKLYAQKDQKLSESCKNEKELAQKIEFLGLLERGTMAVDQGKPTDAIERLYFAEEILNDRAEQTKAAEGLKKIGAFLAETLSGYEEIGPYWGEPYEKILMLNYKSIAYLLEGERKAYNVTRRAIDWQNIAKKEFEEKVREAEIKLEEKKKEQEEKGFDLSKFMSEFKIAEVIAKQYSSMDSQATRVPSAYVNPFGFYVAGVIQELESYSDPSLRHNTLISYKKALELNPDSQVLQQGVEDLQKPSHPSGLNLLHIVIGDGFVPEKKVLTFGIQIGDMVLPIKLPIYEPVASRVSRIEVQTEEGKTLGKFSPVADVETLCLRHQKDMQPIYTLRVILALIRSVVEKKLLYQAGAVGRIISRLRDEMAAPDTRSWMSLPATIQAARLYVPEELNRVKIVTYGEKGEELASKMVDLDTGHNFVYGRAIDNILYAYKNKELWLCKK